MASVYQRGGKGRWIVAWTDENGNRRTLTTKVSTRKGKRIAQQIASKLEADADLRRRGIIDTRLDHYSQGEKIPLVARDGEGQLVGGHLGDFHRAILASGNTDKHARLVTTRAAAIIDRCDAGRISELSPSKVQAAIQELRGDEGLSLQTCNHYLAGIKQFTRWLWRDGRARDDLLTHLQGYNVKLDRRHDRRALSMEGFGKLVKAAERGPVVLGMTGTDRAMLYRVAVGTAFRASELASLTPESFALDGGQPTITVKAGYSKRRTQDIQLIRPDLAAMLRQWLVGKETGHHVFNAPEKTAKMMRADLKAVGIPYRDSAGLVADFHSLRHSAGTWLKDAGVHPTAIQTFMRHSTITLTMDRYVHPSVTNQAAALEHLPPANGAKGVQRICSAQTA